MYIVLSLFYVCTVGFMYAECSYLRTSCFKKIAVCEKKLKKFAFGGKDSEIVKNWSIDVFSEKSFIVISHV